VGAHVGCRRSPGGDNAAVATAAKAVKGGAAIPFRGMLVFLAAKATVKRGGEPSPLCSLRRARILVDEPILFLSSPSAGKIRRSDVFRRRRRVW
jgi:hypothetical protein